MRKPQNKLCVHSKQERALLLSFANNKNNIKLLCNKERKKHHKKHSFTTSCIGFFPSFYCQTNLVYQLEKYIFFLLDKQYYLQNQWRIAHHIFFFDLMFELVGGGSVINGAYPISGKENQTSTNACSLICIIGFYLEKELVPCTKSSIPSGASSCNFHAATLPRLSWDCLF